MLSITGIAALTFLHMLGPSQAGSWHCQLPNGQWQACHMCMNGHWPTGEEHRCTAAQERRQMRDLELKNCSQKPLTEVPDGKFKDRCMEVSRRSP
jgi:hypothetical protein